MQFIRLLLDEYGYTVMFITLLLEFIALPLPGETLMSYCGYLVYMGKLNWGVCIITAAIGTIAGITISYFIGKILGINFFYKYGKYVYLQPKKLDKVSIWFDKYGFALLIVCYYIPGVRHITGYFAGIVKISFKKFVISSYIGAFIWSFTFITLGRFLGKGWHRFHTYIRRYVVLIAVILGIIVLAMFVYNRHKKKK